MKKIDIASSREIFNFFHFVALRNLSLYNFPKWCQKKFRYGIAITVCGISLV